MPMLFKFLVIGLTMGVTIWISTKIVYHTILSNRSVEWPEKEKSDPISEPVLQWTIVHIRDDIGCIHNLLIMTNALLAGVLAGIATLLF